MQFVHWCYIYVYLSASSLLQFWLSAVNCSFAISQANKRKHSKILPVLSTREHSRSGWRQQRKKASQLFLTCLFLQHANAKKNTPHVLVFPACEHSRRGLRQTRKKKGPRSMRSPPLLHHALHIGERMPFPLVVMAAAYAVVMTTSFPDPAWGARVLNEFRVTMGRG